MSLLRNCLSVQMFPLFSPTPSLRLFFSAVHLSSIKGITELVYLERRVVLSLDDARVRETQCYPVRFSLNSPRMTRLIMIL